MSIKCIITATLIVASLSLVPASVDALSFDRNFQDYQLGFNYLPWQGDQDPPAVPEPELKPVSKPAAKKPPQAKRYHVQPGDTLDSIARAHKVQLQRIWSKNTRLDNPDLILVDQVVLIPHKDEKLKRRALPSSTRRQQTIANDTPVTAAAVIAGNGYDYGYCTWYVKNRRPDLPNDLGNANTWYSQAAIRGLTVGSVPRPGAVGTTVAGALGHVVYVERVNGDGSIEISEMNYAGWGIQSNRTARASEFLYIY